MRPNLKRYLTVTTFVTAITQAIVNLTERSTDFEDRKDPCEKISDYLEP